MPIDQSPNMATETEVLKQVYAAINRNDIPAVLELCDPEVVRIEPWGFPMAGTYRGQAEVGAHLSAGRGTWAEGTCEPERFIVAGDKVIAFLHVRVRLKNKTNWTEGRLADVFTFRNGKVIEMRTFDDGQQALEWAAKQ